jgi:hypothetical protein
MKNFRITLSICLFSGLAVTANALAADKMAQEKVAGMARTRDVLLEERPPLRLIDKAVRADCSVKGKGEAPNGTFCSCGSAVTFSLWVSGMDPKMVGRIDKFLQEPSEQAAAEFAAAYQGPELYGPLCHVAF